MTIELVPLCTVRAQAKPPIEVGAGPAGTRLVFEIAQAEIKGDRLTGELLGSASADWLLVGPEGTASLDVRMTYRTGDGAVVLVRYTGRADLSRGMRFPATSALSVLFETGDERYAWLNRIQAVGRGTVHEDLSMDLEWYEVR